MFRWCWGLRINCFLYSAFFNFFFFFFFFCWNSSFLETGQKRKQIIQIFKEWGLQIAVNTNLKKVDLLDVPGDLVSNMYQPYEEPNSKSVYISRHSNHLYYQIFWKNFAKRLKSKYIFHVINIFLMLLHRNKLFGTVVLMKNWNMKTKIAKNRHRIKNWRVMKSCP